MCQEFCSQGGLLPGGVCSWGVPAPGVGGVCYRGVSTPGGSALGGGPCSGGVPGGDPPDGYCCGWYASYWNAFLLYLFPLSSVCSWGVSALGGVCSWGGGLLSGGAWWRPPEWLLLRAVRILLECILVIFISTEQRQRSKTIFALALIKRNRNAITRMHSSRMHTIRCSGRLLDGGMGVSARGGVCLGGCLPRGVASPMRVSARPLPREQNHRQV